MNFIDLKYAGILSTRLERFSVKSNSPYRANLRCPLCGDSQKSKSKTRGWILEKDNTAIYYCHNCGESKSLGNFLRTIAPALYDEYIIDRKLDRDMFKKEEKKDVSPLDKLVSSQPKFTKGTSPLLKIKKVSSLDVTHPAKKYIEDRKIPSDRHYRMYYAPKFNAWVNSMIPDKLPTKYDEPRLVLPFIDAHGNLFGFTGRSFTKSGLRYITIMLDENASKVFGLDVVDFTKQYYVVEGGIDSFFLKNAVAMAGADGNVSGLSNVENAVFVYDNEPRNKEIVHRMQKNIDSGYKVVIWSDRISAYGKDINDMVVNGLKPADIELILSQNTYFGLDAKLALTIWKRV